MEALAAATSRSVEALRYSRWRPRDWCPAGSWVGTVFRDSKLVGFSFEASGFEEQSNIASVPDCKTLHPRALKTCNLASPATVIEHLENCSVPDPRKLAETTPRPQMSFPQLEGFSIYFSPLQKGKPSHAGFPLGLGP